MLGMIHDEDVLDFLGRLQLQPKLLLESSENRRAVGIGAGRSWRLRHKWIRHWRPGQVEIKRARQPGSIQDAAIDSPDANGRS